MQNIILKLSYRLCFLVGILWGEAAPIGLALSLGKGVWGTGQISLCRAPLTLHEAMGPLQGHGMAVS